MNEEMKFCQSCGMPMQAAGDFGTETDGSPSANLSPTRSNGLLSMVKQMRLYALAFASKSEK